MRLVIFDCDGVLVDSERISNRVLAEMLTAEGLEMTMEESRARYQGRLLGEIAQSAEQVLGHTLGEGWIERYESERDVAFVRGLESVPGARQTVERVQACGIAACVASQGTLAKTRRSLELTGLRDLFAEDALFSAEFVSRGKPYPDLFLHAAARIGVPPPDCVVVEDTPSGVSAGRAAGMRVIGYAADADETALSSAGAEIVRSMAEVPGLLGLP